VMIKRQINAAKSRLGEPVEEVAVASKPAELPVATSGATAIQVQVSLDPALKDKAAADDTVFIFARAVQGPRMPLAIVRKRVADLPVSVTLDDSLAMSPAMVLSKFSQVLVGARVSKTGQAMPASGDLQGQVSPVDTQGGSDIQLTIDSVVP
jgi:cytochrome c-type biogenesis protein CcmH